jgi:hypothetical protein
MPDRSESIPSGSRRLGIQPAGIWRYLLQAHPIPGLLRVLRFIQLSS